MAQFHDELYDMQHDKIALRKEIDRLQLGNESLLLENESLKEQLNLMQHENSTLSSDDDSFEKEYDEDGLDDQDQMQYENGIHCRQIDVLQREKQDILLKQRELVSANKRGNSNLRRLLDEERNKNKLLEKENSKLTIVQRHNSCELESSVHSKKASIAERITHSVQEENSDLKQKLAEVRRHLFDLRKKYDRLDKKKTFIKNDNVTSLKKVIDNASAKLTGRSRSTSSKRSLTATIENDRGCECDECKHLHRQNEELKNKNASIQREMDTFRAESNGFEREILVQRKLYEDSILILKRQNELVRSKYERYISLTQQELSSLRETIRKHDEHVKLLENENDKLEQDSKTDISELTRHFNKEKEHHYLAIQRHKKALENATEKTQKMERQISDFNKSEQAFIDERGSLNDNVGQLTNIIKGKDIDIRKIETKLAEFSLIKEENVKAERQITELQIEIQKYKSELKDKSGNLTKLTNTISTLSHESERCKSELKEAHEKIRKFDLQLETVSNEHENCKHLISSLRKENEKISVYKVYQTRRSEATLSQREHELSLALDKSRRELHEVQHELDDTKTKLSKVMEQKLTDKNPNIAQLSDINRPTKLSERYSELYDNHWTHAFEVICNQLHDEQSTIKSLIGILMNAAKYCREEATTQLEALQGILLPRKTGSTFPSLVHKNLKDYRKALGEQTGAAIYEKYLQDIAKQRQQSLQLDVKPYVKECVELCWLMSIQDPPVVVAPELQHGANFDTDLYQAYTKSGTLVDYVVWPALFLHEKGPLLCKGIAQGYSGKKTNY